MFRKWPLSPALTIAYLDLMLSIKELSPSPAMAKVAGTVLILLEAEQDRLEFPKKMHASKISKRLNL
jgi:hypothetical protein